ncbi:MAG: DNA-methyltransferase [Phycisphaerae bacterium]
MAGRINRIIHGDCIEEMGKLEAGGVDLAFADPPFNIGYDYDVYDDKRSCEDYLGWSRRWMAEVIRLLKPTGAFWLAIGDEYAAELKVMATRELGLTCRSWVVWYYTFGVHCKYKFARSHAHLFHFVKDAKRFTFHTDAIRVPSARQLVYGDGRANAKGRVPDDTWILRPQDLPDGFTADGDTWYFPRVCGTFKQRRGFHGCQMPEQLLGRIIKVCSNEGETVLDPFAGSGTTAAVAKKLGRPYLGIELSDEYVTEVRSRLKRIRAGDPLEGAENPLASCPDTANGVVRTADGKRVRRNGKPIQRGGSARGKPTQAGLWG